MRIFSFGITVLLCSCTLTNLAVTQSDDGDSPGRHQVVIQGVALSAFNVPIPQLQISLRNVSNGNIVIQTSNSDGAFQFIAPEGPYVLSAILGTDTATQKLHVVNEQRLVHLKMPARKGVHFDDQSAVSVSQLKIPAAARKSLQDGVKASTRNKTKEAIDYTNRAIDLYPQFGEALAIRATLERNINPQQALMDAEKAIEFDPNFAVGYTALGSVYTEYGRLDDAVKTLNRAIAIQPDSWWGYYEMSRALVGKRDYSAALIQLQRTCNLVPKNYPFLHLAKADVLIGLNDPSSAIRELEAYLQEAPGSPESAKASRALARLRAVTSQTTEPTASAFQPGSGDGSESPQARSHFITDTCSNCPASSEKVMNVLSVKK
jgi:predicted Zn-dependent protease